MGVDEQTQNITKLLLQCVKFYENVDEFSGLLKPDTEELSLFKNDVRVFLFVAEKYQSFTRSFVLYNIDTMRKRFSSLSVACVHSPGYTKKIGERLGIEEEEKIPEATFTPSNVFTSEPKSAKYTILK